MKRTAAAHDLARVQSLLSPVFERIGARKVFVFGSWARKSETRRSDLDLLVVMDTEKRFFDRYDEFDEVYRLMRGTAVDMLIYTPEELERISHRPFIQTILREGKIIYGR
jgi:predicted nucleotidyltransferase